MTTRARSSRTDDRNCNFHAISMQLPCSFHATDTHLHLLLQLLASPSGGQHRGQHAGVSESPPVAGLAFCHSITAGQKTGQPPGANGGSFFGQEKETVDV
jgi:hypothetical protein